MRRQLQCAYHGWRFDASGACRLVPGLVADVADRRARRVETFPVVEQDGFVWVRPDGADDLDDGPSFRFPHVDEAGYTTVRRSLSVDAGLHAALENTLDVPHTAFLHGGLFRGGRPPVDIEVVVRHTAAGVEAEYIGEPRPPGLAGRILAPEGGVVTHVDRFLMPSIAQVEYRLGDNHLVTTTAFTPGEDGVTDLHAAVTFRLRLPPALVRAVVTPVANRIFAQDKAILRQQAENVQPLRRGAVRVDGARRPRPAHAPVAAASRAGRLRQRLGRRRRPPRPHIHHARPTPTQPDSPRSCPLWREIARINRGGGRWLPNSPRSCPLCRVIARINRGGGGSAVGRD